MNSTEFLAVSVAQEINIDVIAKHFGIEKKFKWEEILILREQDLKGILKDEHNKTFYIFNFGCIVAINSTKYDISDFYHYICEIDKTLNKSIDHLKYTDSYRMDINDQSELEIHNNYIVVPKLVDYYLQIIAIVLARSVALDRIEDNVEKATDEIEKIIEYLDKGKLNINDDKLAKLSGKILRFKYNTISYVMILDKPDVTWYKEGADDLFLQLADLFDINERYENLRHKTENIMDITEAFTILAHAHRGNKLEWMIIILIALDIVISLVDKVIS